MIRSVKPVRIRHDIASKRNMRCFLPWCAALCITAFSVPANAVTFDLVGVNSANTTATIDFVYDGVDTLTIDIENTASAYIDPRITGFAFNAPAGVTGVNGVAFSASGTADDSDWSAVFASNGINTPGNNGDFDIAGLTGPNLNGGDPNSGIILNATGTFMIELLGDALFLAGLNEQSFLDIGSFGGANSYFFVARFQQLDGQVTSDSAVPVPVPAALPMLFAALAGLAFFGLRKKYV